MLLTLKLDTMANIMWMERVMRKWTWEKRKNEYENVNNTKNVNIISYTKNKYRNNNNNKIIDITTTK